MFEEENFICECHSIDHVFSITYFPGDNECQLHISLRKGGFWRRVKEGFKYIFGKSGYGAFDEIILQPKDTKRFIEILNKIK